jgi:3-hydroxyisobutyrate dehydrogenase
MLPSSPHVTRVYTDSNTGILSASSSKGKGKGMLLIDSSTIDPGTARSVAAAARNAGFRMIDAPVSGGVGGAEKGTLTFMVGGLRDDFAEAELVLKIMGQNIVHCGDSGAGQAVKIANNLVLAVSMIGVAEGMNLGVKLGIDPKVLAGVLNRSSGRCWSSDTYNPCPGVMENVPSSRGYTGGFSTALMRKDLGLALTAAVDAQAAVPLAAASHQLYTLIAESGNKDKDFSFIYEFLRRGGNDTL